MKNKQENENRVQYMPIGMCLGMPIGMAIGSAAGNTSIGMLIGLCVGMTVGSLIDASRRTKAGDNAPSDDDDA